MILSFHDRIGALKLTRASSKRRTFALTFSASCDVVMIVAFTAFASLFADAMLFNDLPTLFICHSIRHWRLSSSSSRWSKSFWKFQVNFGQNARSTIGWDNLRPYFWFSHKFQRCLRPMWSRHRRTMHSNRSFRINYASICSLILFSPNCHFIWRNSFDFVQTICTS